MNNTEATQFEMSADVRSTLDEIVNLCEGGRSDDALRLSGEELARLDNRWRRAYNKRVEVHDLIKILYDVIVLGNVHAGLLTDHGEVADAFGVDMGLLMNVAVQDCFIELARPLLHTLLNACVCFDAISARMSFDNEDAREHVPAVMRYLVSMLYADYNLVKDSGSPVAADAYEMLGQLIHMVENPLVEVPGGSADPLHPIEIMNDLLGRAHALQLL